MKKLSKKDSLYYERLLVRMFRPCYACKTLWTKKYHYWIEDNGSSLSLWRSDWSKPRSLKYPLERLITIPTASSRKQGQYWRFDEQ